MIEGKLVDLCGLTRDTAGYILRWVNDPELKHYTGTLYPVSEYEHEKWLENRAISKTEKTFVIREKNSKVLIGTIGITNIDYPNSNAEMYICIGNKDFISSQNATHGYGSDAVMALTDFCFNRLNLHKVYLRVFDGNERAVKCYQKAGFTVEGRLAEHHFDNGKYMDVLIMSKIRDESNKS